MNFAARDFFRLRWSLVFLVAMIVGGAALVYFMQQIVDKAEISERELSRQVADIHGRVFRAHEEEQDMRGRIQRFQEMTRKGIIGQEERLNWVEQIARIKAARRLLDVQYEIQPQGAISSAALPGGAAAGPYEIMASTMKLHMQLLHEEDLVGFVADLRQAVHAHLLVRECRIERNPGGGTQAAAQAQLQADCTIDWVTLREKKS
jgi:hypothetical protein